MKFGFFLMPCHHPTESPTLAFQRDLEMVQVAEDLGYDEVWIGEHHSGGWENIPAPDIFIAAAAQRTRRIRLGAGVVNLPYHHPFHVAERMAFLDQLTLGRVMLGVGPGALPTDLLLFGLKPEETRGMLRESLELILRLFREEAPITHEGPHWTIRGGALQVRPYQQPHLPVALASSGRGLSVELIARHGLLMLSGSFFGGATGEQMGQQWQRMAELAQGYGRRPDRQDWRVATYVYVAESAEEALAQIREGAERQFREYWFSLGMKPIFEDYRGQPGAEMGVAHFARKGSWIIGDPDECARKLKELEASTGGFGSLLIVDGGWARREHWHRSMELFARCVMPQLRGSARGLQGAHERLVRDGRAGVLPDPFRGGTLPPVKD